MIFVQKWRRANVEKLKHCPFCGGSNIDIRTDDGGLSWYSFCNDCGVIYGYSMTKDDVINAWNNRMEERKMNDFTNEKTCSGEEQKRETVKELLEDTDKYLREMKNHIDMISDAVYRGANRVEKGPATTNEPRATPPMVVIMREQRDTAECLLKEIIKIREALW